MADEQKMKESERERGRGQRLARISSYFRDSNCGFLGWIKNNHTSEFEHYIIHTSMVLSIRPF